jgi:pimeloyl-ACP methyl ester carboxylesterase
MTKPLLLCLHGWGGSKESFTELREAMKDMDCELLTPDLPGFGDEPEPPAPWDIEQYAVWVSKWMRDRFTEQELRDRSFSILGHSHGGRIAIWITVHSLLPVSHLFLCAAAGIRHPRHFKRIAGLTLAKTGKFFLKIPGLNLLQPIGKKFLYKLVRLHDYEKASALMQQTMIKVVSEDLRPLIAQIQTPTDLFWGESDGMTPIADGRLMHNLIVGSTLHTYPDVRHAVHRDRAKEIAEIVRHTFVREARI